MTDNIGTVAIVNGIETGIGRSVALNLAGSGADVVGISDGEFDDAELGAHLQEMGRRLLALTLDRGDSAMLESAISEVMGWGGRLDTLVNVTGAQVRSDVFETTRADWDRTVATTFTDVFFMIQAVSREMLAGDGGSIVNVTSISGKITTSGASVAYSSSKAALSHLTRVLAARLGPSIRVNAVAPGYLRTPLTSDWLDDPENMAFVLGRTALGKIGRSDDIAAAVSFLASASAGHITGQEIVVDGGWQG